MTLLNSFHYLSIMDLPMQKSMILELIIYYKYCRSLQPKEKIELGFLISQKLITKLIEHCEKAIVSSKFAKNNYKNDYDMEYLDKDEEYNRHEEHIDDYPKKNYPNMEKHGKNYNKMQNREKNAKEQPIYLGNIINILDVLIKNCLTPEMIKSQTCPTGHFAEMDKRITISNEEITLFISKIWDLMKLAKKNTEQLSDWLVILLWESEERSKTIIPVVLGEIHKKRFKNKFVRPLNILKKLLFIRDSKIIERFNYAFISSTIEKHTNLIIFIKEDCGNHPELTISVLSFFAELSLTQELALTSVDLCKKLLEWVPREIAKIPKEVVNELQQELI